MSAFLPETGYKKAGLSGRISGASLFQIAVSESDTAEFMPKYCMSILVEWE